MLLGSLMKGPVHGWRFVEADLHDIAGRVIQYDADARLVRNDESGQLGLARWMRSNLFANGGYWSLARTLFDLDTDLPLLGEPDARVLRFQRATDSYGRNLAEWRRRSQDAEWRQEAREQEAVYETNMDHAERFMSALKHDVSARPRAFVPKSIPKAA